MTRLNPPLASLSMLNGGFSSVADLVPQPPFAAAGLPSTHLGAAPTALSHPDALRMEARSNSPTASSVAVTPAQVSALLFPGESPAPALQHTVQQGETLGKIAQHYLGDASLFLDIYNANRDDLRNPNDLRIGMVLNIPLPAAPLSLQTLSPLGALVAAPAPSVSFTPYTVQRGESLSEIALNQLGDAERYMDIFHANTDQLKNPNALKSGMVLQIPQNGNPTSVASLRSTAAAAAGTAVTGAEGLSTRATELLGAMQRYQQYHTAQGNTQRTQTTPAQMREIAIELDQSAQAFGVDPKMMLALFAHESGGINPRARSHTGAGGLGQLTGIAIRQVHHMSGIAKGFRGSGTYREHKGNFVQSTRAINPRYNIKANVWTSVAYMSYELNERAHLGRGVKNALKRYGDPNVATYANKVNAEYKTLFGGSLF